MKYGMNLLLWTDELSEEIIPTLEELKATGYDAVELPFFEENPGNCVQWAKRLDSIGLERTAVTARTETDNPISPDKSVREIALAHNKRAVDCCEVVGAPLLVGPYHSALGYFTGQAPTKDEWNYGVESMRALAEYAERRGVTLGVEYLNRFECYFLNCVEDTVRFVKEVDHPNCKMIYDTFHANIEEKNLINSIRESRDFLCHVHISENDRGTPGEGHVAWNEVFGSLIEEEYNGYLMIEAFGTKLPRLAAATKIWRKMYKNEMQLARDGLAFMKFQWEDNPANRRELFKP